MFLPHSDAAKSNMQEALRYKDGRLQKGVYYVVCTSHELHLYKYNNMLIFDWARKMNQVDT